MECFRAGEWTSRSNSICSIKVSHTEWAWWHECRYWYVPDRGWTSEGGPRHGHTLARKCQSRIRRCRVSRTGEEIIRGAGWCLLSEAKASQTTPKPPERPPKPPVRRLDRPAALSTHGPAPAALASVP